MKACGVWYRGEGCPLPYRHRGPHQAQAQIEIDRLTADLAALERDNARLRATLERAADLSRVSYYDRAACGLCKRFEGHEHDCPFAALSPERPGDAGMEGR
jgi:hypothetical protein